MEDQLCLSELPQVYSVVSRNCRSEPDISPLQISFLKSYQNQTYIKESLWQNVNTFEENSK